MKNFIVISLLSLMTLSSYGQNTLNVYQHDGKIFCYAFSTKPQAIFSGTNVIIKTTNEEVVIPQTDIKEFTFVDGVTPNGVISIHTDAKAKPVHIYTAGGKLVRTIEPKDSHNIETSIDGLAPGIYVIRNGGTTYKIHKR